MDVEKIGNAIKTLRSRKKMTQQDLADALGVTDKAVSRWERGIGAPDLSLISQLVDVLDTDIENLLEGNISYLEHSWEGVLILEDDFADQWILSKPCVYLPLAYFLLVGIRKIRIYGSKSKIDFMKKLVGQGERLGIGVKYHTLQPDQKFHFRNSMVIFGTPLLYGPNLTRYFQKAIGSMGTLIMLSIPYELPEEIHNSAGNAILPLVFFHEDYEYEGNPADLWEQKLIPCMESGRALYQEMGLGMIYKRIQNHNDLLDASMMLRLLEQFSGKEIYNLEDIARNRGLI